MIVMLVVVMIRGGHRETRSTLANGELSHGLPALRPCDLPCRRPAATLIVMLAVRGLAKSFAGPRPRSVFADVDLDLAPGEYLAVMGEAGSGKETG